MENALAPVFDRSFNAAIRDQIRSMRFLSAQNISSYEEYIATADSLKTPVVVLHCKFISGKLRLLFFTCADVLLV
jgi:predicted LPLAT superfamily acyltransferase